MANVALPLPRLSIELFDDDATTHGPGTRVALIHEAAKVGWSWYSRFPANAFFSLRQTSAYNALITPGLSHVRIWYTNDSTGYGPVLVFNGRVGDPDESGDDVIWTAWSYLAELALSRTGYNRYYKNKKLGSEIVNFEWLQDSGSYLKYGAKVQTHSLLNHVATGNIQDPLDAGGTFAIATDAQFGVIDVPRLLLFFDLSEMGRANTTNNVTFEISRSTTPTFNFWRNAGTQRTDKVLMFPGIVRDFRYVPGVLDIRNDLATIGIKASAATEIVRTVTGGTYGINAFGLRQDTFTIKTLAGYKNIDDTAGTGVFTAQGLITTRAVTEAAQLTKAIRLDLRNANGRVAYGLFEPFDGWEIEDTVKLQISQGITVLDQYVRVIGARGVLDENGYTASIFVQPPTT